MGGKTRAVVIGAVWIVLPWSWGIAAYQLRHRRAAGMQDAPA